MSYIILIETKQTLLAWRASKSETELRGLDWQVRNKGRKSGEAGGGVWIVTKSDAIEMIAFHHESITDNDDKGLEDLALQDIVAAFVRTEGAEE